MLNALLPSLRRWQAGEWTLSTDAARAFRAAAGMAIPLCLAETGRFPLDVIFAAIAAQNVAQMDVRGSYSLRLAFLASAGLFFALAAALGAWGAQNLPLALLFTAALSVIAGGLRHLSTEYGPPVGVPMTLIFLMSLGAPLGQTAMIHVGSHLLSILGGCVIGGVLQMAFWPFRPQHPLRAATAECWLATADLIAALNAARGEDVTSREADLRATLDRTLAILHSAGSVKMRPLVQRLERLHLLAAQIGTRTMALQTLLDREKKEDTVAALQPALRSLENTARSTALTLVSRNPAHLALFNVRLRRVLSLLGAVRARAVAAASPLPVVPAASPPLGGRGEDAAGTSGDGDVAATAPDEHLLEVLGQIECLLPVLQVTLGETVDRANERGAFSLELLDLHTWRLGSLPAALNLSPRLDRTLGRYIVRITLLMVAGVFLFKWFAIPHGYWLPLTFIVVMQPEYGATRQRAGERVLGTLLGSALASGVLFLHLPHRLLIAAVTLLTFGFAYFLKRRYGVAVVFVTVMVVLLTEIGGPVTLQLTAERIALTLAGGLIALGVAYALWPVWERDRFHPLLAGALAATRVYLREICQRLRLGTARDPVLVAAKRRAETASGEVFGSLRRLYGEPHTAPEALQRAATLANGNLRLIRLLHVLLLHLAARPGAITGPQLVQFQTDAEHALEALAAEENPDRESALRLALSALEKHSMSKMAGDPDGWVSTQLSYASTELSALLVAALSKEAPVTAAMRASSMSNGAAAL